MQERKTKTEIHRIRNVYVLHTVDHARALSNTQTKHLLCVRIGCPCIMKMCFQISWKISIFFFVCSLFHYKTARISYAFCSPFSFHSHSYLSLNFVNRQTICSQESLAAQQIRMLKYACYRIKQTFGKPKSTNAH